MKKNIRLSTAVMAVVVSLLIGAFPVVRANISYDEVIAQTAGVTLGNALAQKMIDSGKLDMEGEGMNIGAVSNPILQSEYFGFGNIVYRNLSFPAMNKATTTLCVFQNPFTTGTSTLISYSYQITAGTSTAATLVLATSTSAYSTSSAPFGAARTVASGAQDSAHWLPAVAWNGNGTIIGPSEYILLKTEGAGLSGYTYTGQCKASFKQL